jgi:large subunit ribosomal protein L11
MIVKLIVDGGDMKPGPAVAQQIGPLGINMGKVISDVNTATAGFKGTKVPVEIDVNTKTKTYKINVFSPPVAELIKKELGLEKGSGASGTVMVGNVSVEQLIGIAKTKQSSLLAKDLKSALKLVVGTCVSLGVLVDNKNGAQIEKDIDSGIYDKQIKGEITSPTPEKAKEIASFFAQVKDAQDRKAKAAAEAKAAEEAAAAAAAATAAPGATPAAAAATPAAAAAKPAAKAPAKK